MPKFNYLFVLLLFLMLWFNSAATAQSIDSAKKKYENRQYDDALRELNQLYKANPKDIETNHYLAKCYLALEIRHEDAIEHLMTVAAWPRKNYIVYKELGIAYMHEHLFDLAINYFNQYQKKSKKKEEKAQAQHYIEQVLNAQALTKSPIDVSFMNLGPKINTRFNEINPRVSANEKHLFFSTDRNGHMDIYQTQRKANSYWHKATNSGFVINTAYDEYLAGTSPNMNQIFIHYNSFSTAEDIKSAYFYRNELSSLKSLDETINTIYPEEGACISPSGDTLYFARKAPDAVGELDLFYSIKLPNGKWGQPLLMNQSINTPWNENYPVLSHDGAQLYFCSEGHNSMGGYDIFIAEKDSVGEFSNPKNLGYPINNTFNNYNIAMVKNERYGYLSTIRHNSVGRADIYKVVFNEVAPQIIVYRGKIMIVEQPENRVISENDTPAKITVYDKQKDSVYGIYAYNKTTGAYVVSLSPGKYELVVQADNFHTYRKVLVVSEKIYHQKIIDLNIYLQKK